MNQGIESGVGCESCADRSRVLAVIDSRVKDYWQLERELASTARVIVVNETQAALVVLTDVLANERQIDALHLFAHGRPGALELGDSLLDQQAIESNRELFGLWRQTLAADAAVFIYGCRSAEGGVGERFIWKLSQVLARPVEACSKDVGAFSLGGTWDLDVVAGSAVPLSRVSSFRPSSWQGLLAIPNVTVSGASNFESSNNNDPNYLSWTISLSEPATDAVTVEYRFLAGTASVGSSAAGADAYFYNSGTSVTFAAGETSKTVSYRIDGDSVDEVDETVILEVYSAQGAALAGDVPVLRATGWILDDDGTGNNLALYVSRPVLVEGDTGQTQASFEVSLSRPAPTAFTVDYETVDGSAVAGEDYQATSGTLNFVAGQTSGSVTVPVFGDTKVEPTELFSLSFDKPAEVAAVSIGAAEVFDDDAGGESQPTVNVSGASNFESSNNNDPNYLSWTISLSEPATDAVTVEYRFLAGTASVGSSAAGADAYFYNSGTSVTFAAGETSKTVSYRIDGDSVDEVDETVILEVYSAQGAALAGDVPVLRATGWILDDDGTGNNLALYVSRPVLVEGDTGQTQASFEVSLSRPAPTAFTVDYETVDGSAVAGEDYQATSGTLNFVAGQTSGSVTVPVFGDTKVEPTELFSLSFDKPAEVAAVSIGAAEVFDDDAGGESQPTVNVSGASNFESSNNNDPNYLSWTISLSEPATDAVTVEYRFLAGTASVGSSAAGADAYFYNSGTSVTFAAGETSKTVSYRIDGDSVDEVDETVILEVYSAQGAALAGDVPVLRATGWILDDDGTGNNLALYVSRPVLVEGDTGQTQASFEVSLSRPAPTAFTVDYETVDGSAVAGEDYQATSGTLNFVAGQTSGSVTVPVFGDTKVEPTELFSLSFDKPAEVAAVSIGAAEVFDDDAGGESQPTVNVSGASNFESSNNNDPNYLSWTISLSEPATDAVTVEYRFLAGTASVGSSAAGADAYFYNSGTSVTFAAGETSKTVSYRIDGDSVDEVDETVILEVYSAQGAALAGDVPVLRATGWILDDDGTGNNLALYVSRPVLVEGDTGQTQASFEVSLSRPAPTAFTVDYETVDGSAVAGEDYQATSGTLNFVAGQTSGSVTVPVFGDTKVEPTELFSLSFDKPAEVAAVSIGAAEVFDDDAGGESQPTVNVSGASNFESSNNNDPNYLSWTISLSEPATDAVTVEYRFLAGTASVGSSAAGADAYFYNSGTSVTFAAGETSKTVSYRIDGDSVDEVDETVILEVYSAQGAALAGNAPTLYSTGWILDDDGLGNNLALYVEDAQIFEGPSGQIDQVAVPITLSRPPQQAITLSYSTSAGTATSGVDYEPVSGTVTFGPGQTYAAALIPIIGDSIDEPSETFTLTVIPTAAIASGTAGATGTVTIVDGDNFDGAAVDAGADETLNEGDTLTKTITFTDGEDSNSDGWTYSVDWDGDGNADDSGAIAAGSSSFEISHTFADGPDVETVSVTVFDTSGNDQDTDTFDVTVNNVAPTLTIAGANEISEDSEYTLTLGTAVDPGEDTVSSYVVHWGDGSDDTYASDGDVTHTYANPGDYTITVDVIDEDGTYSALASLDVTVTPVSAPLPVEVDAGTDATLNEGQTLTKTITFADGEDSNTDGWSYSIDWDGDGNADDSGSIAAGSSSFEISHTFADGPDVGTVSVTVSDTSGNDQDTDTFDVTVNNVAPTLTIAGGNEVPEDSEYTLTLGTAVDPGEDTVSSYIVHWGDGSEDTYAANGDVTHTYADPGGYTITVDVVDEDGTYSALASLDVTVTPVSAPLPVEVDAGADATLNEGQTLTKTITFTDGEDSNADGWSYSVDWNGDGVVDETNPIAAGATSFEISNTFADGPASQTVSVTVTDTGGTDQDSDTFDVAVNNVAPTLGLNGDSSVQEDGLYTLTLGAVVDPGEDTIANYVVHWGDGSDDIYTTNGDVTHTFADPGVYTITVDLVDEDGTYTDAASLDLTVTDVDEPDPVALVSSITDETLNEADTLTKTIIFTDGEDSNNDGWSYEVDWDGDGVADEAGSIAAGATSFEVSNAFADGPEIQTVSVTISDTGGADQDTATFDVTVHNVEPTVAVSGDNSVTEDTLYTLTLGAVTDPGDDTVSNYVVHWGDGTDNTYTTNGDATHTYADAGDYTISVDLVDEDGTYTDVATLPIEVFAAQTDTVRIGDAPVRQLRSDPTAWEDAWSNPDIGITHKADVNDDFEPWTDVTFSSRASSTLAGGDVLSGDLGVSGQTIASGLYQEIDGVEGLKFELAREATGVTVDIARLFADDDGSNNEAGRLQAFDAQGALVDELVFSADSASHEKQVSLQTASAFASVVLTAGAYDGSDFVFGAYVDDAGETVGRPTPNGSGFDGSDFMVDAIEFEFPVVAATQTTTPMPSSVSAAEVALAVNDAEFDFTASNDMAASLGTLAEDADGQLL
ncbi:Calx-beta domain-containing protein [Thiosocius teredinicola]|uniref:Calx-beta domain-containing protein n=1 Tax=Thiosocius teredinicola TaxID=1973002 RepID=UPI000990C35C